MSTNSDHNPSAPEEKDQHDPSMASKREEAPLKPLGERLISIFRNVRETRPLDQVPVARALDDIRTGKYSAYVEHVRSIDDKAERSKAKQNGPAYTFSGRFTRRDQHSLVEHSGLVCLDYDNVADPEELRLRLQSDPHVYAVFESVSGRGGLKVLVPVTPVPKINEQHRMAYGQAAALFGSAVDRVASDLPRLCFTSYDPNIYVNEAAVPLVVDYAKPRSMATSDEPADEITTLRDGQKYHVIRRVGGMLRHYGLSGPMIETALFSLLDNHAESPADPKPVKKLVEWLAEKPPGANLLRALDDGEMLSAQYSEYSGQKENGSGQRSASVDRSGLKAAFRTTAELESDPPQETKWFAEGVLPVGALVQLTGAAKGGGKTTFLLHLISDVVHGRLFLGKPTMHSSVVYLTEQSRETFENEYLRRTVLLGRDDVHVLYGHHTTAHKWYDIAAIAVEKAFEVGAGIICIDTFPYFARVSDEQDAAIMGRALRPLQDAAARGITVVLVHHDRKGGGEPWEAGRGSSAFAGAVDVLVNLRRPPSGQRETIRELRAEGRYGGLYTSLMIELGEDGYHSCGSAKDVVRRETESVILQMLPVTAADAITLGEVMEAVKAENGAGRSTVQRVLDALTSSGRVRTAGVGVKNDPYRYFYPLQEE